MSVWTQHARAPAAPTLTASAPGESRTLRVAVFFLFAAFAAVQYGTLLSRSPSARLIALAAIASAGGGVLAFSARARPRLVALGAAALVLLGSLALGLLEIGVPAHLLLPTRWGTLAHDLHRGYLGLAGWLWPYRGGDRWARIAVLTPVPLALVAAAGLCCWPSARGVSARRGAALSLLLALFLVGAANEQGAAWGFQGAALAALTAAWFWLPGLPASDATRASAWMLICSASALLIAPAVSASGPWIDYRSWNPVAATTSFQWDETDGPIRWSQSAQTMFELAEQHPGLLRVSTLDRFDGRRFLRSPAPPGSTALDVPRAHARAWTSLATVRVGEISSKLLLSAGGAAVAARWLGPGADPISAQADQTMAFRSTPTQGDSYEVSSYAPAPTPSALRHAASRVPLLYRPYTRFELPGARAGSVGSIQASPYGPMFALAHRLAAGAQTPYDVAMRIDGFLLANYGYDERVPREPYPLEAFLFKDRRGYCQQFAGAMALMLRMDGVPARVAAGFRPGVYDPTTQRWRVRALDAHSWVEVYFAGFGWVAFDPTPPRRAGSLAGGASGIPSKAALLAGTAQGRSAARASQTNTLVHARATRARGGGSILRLVAAALGAGLAAAAASWWLVGARRLRRALSGDAGGAVAELRYALIRLGYAGAQRITLASLEHDLRHARRPLARRYVSVLRELRYGNERGGVPQLRERRELRRALAEGGGIGLRVRALLALPPGAARRSSAVSGSTAPPVP